MDAKNEIGRLRTRPIDARTAVRRYAFCPGALWAERDLPSRDITRTQRVQGLDIEARLARTAAATKALLRSAPVGLCTVYRVDSSTAFVAIAQEDGFDIACFDGEAILDAWKESVKWRARLLKNPATAPRVPSEQACAGCRARETYRCPETQSGSRDRGKGS